MSLVIGCDTGSLGLDDIFRLISGIDVDGNIYIRLCDDETPRIDLSELDCEDTATMLDILRGALFLNDDGEYCLNVSSARVFCATYQTIYDAFTTKPSDTIAAAQNTMVCGLVDDGVWAKLDLFLVYAQTTNAAGEALVNWVSPGVNDATAVNAPAFVALEGFTGDGLAAYIDHNVAPSALANYALDSATAGCYIRNNVAVASRELGVKSNNPPVGTLQLLAHNAGNAFISVNTDGATDSNPSLDSRGMWIAVRDAANNQDMYRNGGLYIDGTDPSSAVPNLNLVSLAYNNLGVVGNWSQKQLSLVFVGSAFTVGDITNMTNRFETYMDSNGKGVIP